ncbi:MAG TPA: YbaK/EbsC family protein [Candidatus Deferrimicrobium sp.]|nr:YbaK/EbsC family protein [Candidatus Deferrimicrobium sp.]
MSATGTVSADPRLLAWLAERDVEYEVHEHALAFTARGSARAERVDPQTFAKVVVARAEDGRVTFFVIEAIDELDLAKAARTMGTDTVRLLTEHELKALAPDCEVGAVPAVGALFDVPMVADHALRDDRDISFNAGSHRCSVRVERAGWERAAGVLYADLAVDHDDRPVWSRS